ncbi:carbon-nitrogen hydrolase family protein [Helicobacter marmotae]|uniref:Carbon-nitrogen hydrolase family protein n=1 Tax=Helicobacter marmotae TaxID=152490 RepID=A0A3D8I365_9HELI|nr:carbon-nitrogen hydrolase family protein [Helicobacter marmotae]RDU59525.1 carbon-nitrogen hydrolase family protein [Helicobacter marmotae]
MISKKLYSMQIKSGQDFTENLKQVEDFVAQCGKDAIICTPEVVLSGFAYQRMNEASEFSKSATEALLVCSAKYKNTIVTTMIEEKNKKFYNNLKVFSKGEMVHKQSKNKLFLLGDEHLHFSAGEREEISIFEIDGIKCAALICFELRFVELWEQIKGADIIFVSAQWGKARKNHFEILSAALAVANQAFVVASNSANDIMARGSAIITPYGIVYKNDKKHFVACEVDISETSRMRKYINTNIKIN